jgi:hypothetical protein
MCKQITIAGHRNVSSFHNRRDLVVWNLVPHTWSHAALTPTVWPLQQASEEVRRPFQLASLDEPVGSYFPDQQQPGGDVRDGSFSAMLAALLRGKQLADNATLGAPALLHYSNTCYTYPVPALGVYLKHRRDISCVQGFLSLDCLIYPGLMARVAPG